MRSQSNIYIFYIAHDKSAPNYEFVSLKTSASVNCIENKKVVYCGQCIESERGVLLLYFSQNVYSLTNNAIVLK